MKKFYSLVFATVFAIGFTNAQCTIDSTAQTTPGVNPTAENLPCLIIGVPYDQTLQGKIQSSKDTTILGYSATIRVDSVRIDSIAGVPAGITWSRTPTVLLGGGNGCVRFAGTATGPAGRTNLTAYGTAWLRIIAPGTPLGNIDTPYTRQGNLNAFSPFGGYYLDVIASGTTCDHSALGINDFNSSLNSSLSVYPNPSSGIITVKLNAGQRVNGEVNVIDATGRVVYNEKLDVIGLYNTTIDLTGFAKGLYTVQLRTAEGIAAKNISVE